MIILITGALGLIGRALCPLLENAGHQVIPFDFNFYENHSFYGDILDSNKLKQVSKGCDGIIHLAGVSRVIWGHQDPQKCWRNNVDGTRNVINAALDSPTRPWVLFSSSREVYGEQSQLPVKETKVVFVPKNIYAKSKLEAEKMILSVRESGLITGILRLSSVYGDIKDHSTRVVPAFTRAAVVNEVLSIEGQDNICDFTYVGDIANAMKLFIEMLQYQELCPPIHLVSGNGTSLVELAQIAINAIPDSSATIIYKPPRSYDVQKFIGCPALAKSLLGWETSYSIEKGVQMMATNYSKLLERV